MNNDPAPSKLPPPPGVARHETGRVVDTCSIRTSPSPNVANELTRGIDLFGGQHPETLPWPALLAWTTTDRTEHRARPRRAHDLQLHAAFVLRDLLSDLADLHLAHT
jgi:hypothetical protein